MKGIILAGGAGTRLHPLTKITSKQLLPVYDRPMVFYPLQTLLDAGIKEILFIIAPQNAGDFLKLLGSGKEFGAKFTYEIQDRPEGLAQAFLIGRDFIGEDNVAMILGDNIFEDNFSQVIKRFKSGAQIFAKKVSDPERFGVVAFDKQKRAITIQEKPKKFISPYAITGLYLYDRQVSAIAQGLKPSNRGELEITDLHNAYLKKGELSVDVIRGRWFDAGTFDSLAEATDWAKHRKVKTLKKPLK
jgi:glucose-1-phosphate thymidylyltransferase